MDGKDITKQTIPNLKTFKESINIKIILMPTYKTLNFVFILKLDKMTIMLCYFR